MGYRIQRIDARTASGKELHEMWEYYKAVRFENLPDDPEYPYEREVLDWQSIRENQAIDRWLLRDDDNAIVASAAAARDLDQNLDNAFARIHVREDMRKQGLGTLLAEPILELLVDDGRKRLATDAKEVAVG